MLICACEIFRYIRLLSLRASSVCLFRLESLLQVKKVHGCNYNSNVIMQMTLLEDTQQDRQNRPVVIVFSSGQETIVQVAADILGRTWNDAPSLPPPERDDGCNPAATGILAQNLPRQQVDEVSPSPYIPINTHCVNDGSAPDETLTERCDHEFWYSNSAIKRSNSGNGGNSKNEVGSVLRCDPTTSCPSFWAKRDFTGS